MTLALLASFFLGMGFASFTVLDWHLAEKEKCSKQIEQLDEEIKKCTTTMKQKSD